jgi:hypothetical protein
LHIKNLELYLPNQKQNDMSEENFLVVANHFQEYRYAAAVHLRNYRREKDSLSFRLYIQNLTYSHGFSHGVYLSNNTGLTLNGLIRKLKTTK